MDVLRPQIQRPQQVPVGFPPMGGPPTMGIPPAVGEVQMPVNGKFEDNQLTILPFAFNSEA